MDVNIKVSYTTHRDNKLDQYIIKSINFGLAPNDNMNITMIKFYPSTPTIVKHYT